MNAIQEETYYGIVPIKSDERLYDFKSMLVVTASYGIATWCYVQGAWVSSVLPFYVGLFATLVGILLFAIPTFLITIICCRFGCDIWIYQRALYGKKLNLILLIFSAIIGCGWSAVNARVFAGSTLLVANSAGAGLGQEYIPWFGAICVLAGLYIAYNGPLTVKKFSFLIVPVLIVVGILTVLWVFSDISPAELNQTIPVYASDYGSVHEALMYVMESNFAYCLAWFIAVGTLPRLTKTESASTWGIFLGLGFAMALFICLGIVTGAYMGTFGIYSEDPTEALLKLGGPVWGAISLIAISFANIGTQAVEIYGFALVTKILKPDWNYKKVCLGWGVLILIYTFSGKIWEYYSSFVSVGGCVYAPAIALLFVDFFIVRKQRFSLKSAYLKEKSYDYHSGFNLVSLTAFLVGIIVYFALFDPVEYVAKSPIFFITTATGGAFLSAGLTYWLLSLVPFCKKYLLKDQAELDERLGKDYLQR